MRQVSMRGMGVVALALGAGLMFAPSAHATGQGDQCWNWHATMQDSSGRTLTCTHLADSGHMMYWEYGGAQDSAYKTGTGFKTDDQSDWYGFGSGRPCNSNDVTVIKATERGNAIERWGPKGCDPSLPMTGTN